MKARPAGSGVTGSWRVTLESPELTHDAAFQSVDERAAMKDLGGGRMELDFVDSYRYNIAAYRLAVFVGIGDMVPVSVRRSWRGRRGSMTWWVDDVLMDEKTMNERGVKPPDEGRWLEQVYSVRAFSELVHDTDRNQSNLLITEDWRLFMIDFTRAFRRWPKLRRDDLHRCDRELYEGLKSLSRESLEAELGELLDGGEIEGVLARRDLLVAHFDELIRERGKEAVLY